MKINKVIKVFILTALILGMLAVPAIVDASQGKQDISDAFISNLNTAYVYTGKNIKPRIRVNLDLVEIKDNGDGTITETDYWIILDEGEDYSVSYKNNIGIGTATVIVNGLGDYKGTVSETYTILPKTMKIKGASAGKKELTVNAGKVDGGCSYQFAYRKAGNKKWKYTNSKSQRKIIKHLKSGKTYYVKARAYKTVKGKVYSGKWSEAKKIRVN